ncbi:TPA: hypothetical protein MNE07_002861 [Klebsiella pneumoniae]|uniref:hypothetical protein n=1 Tax=Klebsiella pneumoniae TaxID=573 RepID=UPI0028A38113|nr:hypothetical protein [Klebsiella pneumoniae]HBQ0971641.1 hypothetical protein [Klebsiella pneumoniae]HBQ1283463.1 hypothetical protein [Klebsiella pneumoniae]HBU7099867.1 hypothetical protein [Klebsiella pneumoniae]HBU8820358.1 hypothetical protein [Klebsiella pneumoniae]
MKNEIEQIALQNDMSIEFVTWFFNEKKVGCGNVWFMMMAAMWEGWKGRSIEMDKLAAENVALKQSERELDKTCAEEFGQDWVSEFTETPATDRIVAEAEARGVEKFAAHLRANDNGASVCKMIALGADDFAKHLREGAK